MKDLGKIVIRVTKDDANHYSFEIIEDNDSLSCIKYVIEDALYKY